MDDKAKPTLPIPIPGARTSPKKTFGEAGFMGNKTMSRSVPIPADHSDESDNEEDRGIFAGSVHSYEKHQFRAASPLGKSPKK